MKSLKQTYLIDAPVEKVWQALVDPKIIDDWGGGIAKMDDKEGTKFSLWGGDIHGINTKVIKEKLLEQDWMAGEWENYSKVIFKLTSKNGQTKVELTHEGIPDMEFGEIDDGWKKFYLGTIKELLES